MEPPMHTHITHRHTHACTHIISEEAVSATFTQNKWLQSISHTDLPKCGNSTDNTHTETYTHAHTSSLKVATIFDNNCVLNHISTDDTHPGREKKMQFAICLIKSLKPSQLAAFSGISLIHWFLHTHFSGVYRLSSPSALSCFSLSPLSDPCLVSILAHHHTRPGPREQALLSPLLCLLLTTSVRLQIITSFSNVCVPSASRVIFFGRPRGKSHTQMHWWKLEYTVQIVCVWKKQYIIDEKIIFRTL